MNPRRDLLTDLGNGEALFRSGSRVPWRSGWHTKVGFKGVVLRDVEQEFCGYCGTVVPKDGDFCKFCHKRKNGR